MTGISTNAMAKLGRNEDVRVNILEKLCITLNCSINDIVEFTSYLSISKSKQNIQF